jgi:hypothetical protein
MLKLSCVALVTCLVACQVGEVPIKSGDTLIIVPASAETRAVLPSAQTWNVYQTSAGNHIVAVDERGTAVAELETITERSGASTIRSLSPDVAEQHVGPDGMTTTFPQSPRAAALLGTMQHDIEGADDAPYYSCWLATLDLWASCNSGGGWSLDIGGCCCSTLWYQWECYSWWFDSCDSCYGW